MSKENSKKAKEENQVFEFEPIKGYPMLNWKGKRPFTSTQYFPAQLKEVYGKPDESGWMNKIFWGDNLQVMSHLLKEFRGKVDLIYIDPPFDSKADYKRKIKLKNQTISNDQSTIEEKQYSDVWSNDEYLQFMYERIILLKELLNEKGVIYLHCDHHKSHHLRCILDEVFGNGEPNGDGAGFRNEVIWCYSDAANSKKYWNTKHDNIYFYSKSTSWTFNYLEVLREMSDANIKKYRYEDQIGKYRLFGKNVSGSPIQWHRDVDPKWEKTNPELVFRHYLKDGSLPLDWWNINPVNQAAHERMNYPTQKPEELLERIIKSSTNKGDLVFDCFMGAGTTQAVALNLDRRFIGADINVGSIQVTAKRINSIIKKSSTKPGMQLFNVNNYDVFRNPAEAKDILINILGITKINSSVYDGELEGKMVKIMPVNRISTRADLSEIISNLDYKKFEKKIKENPGAVVEKILLVCMGHEPDLKASFIKEVNYKIDLEIVDILKDKTDIQFKRDSEAKIKLIKGRLVIEKFYPMNLLQKLSLNKEKIGDWKELVESVLIDFNYDGAVLQPSFLDIPSKNELVAGTYEIPESAGTIRIKITDLLSESIEVEIVNE